MNDKNVINIESSTIENFEKLYNQIYNDFSENFLKKFDRCRIFVNTELTMNNCYDDEIYLPKDSKICSIIKKVNGDKYNLDITLSIGNNGYTLIYKNINLNRNIKIYC